MIDLDDLEKKLDEALSKETPESLRSWLEGKRKSPLETLVSRRKTYRIKIMIERHGIGTTKEIGERWIDVDENLDEVLRPLPDDREIMGNDEG